MLADSARDITAIAASIEAVILMLNLGITIAARVDAREAKEEAAKARANSEAANQSLARAYDGWERALTKLTDALGRGRP